LEREKEEGEGGVRVSEWVGRKAKRKAVRTEERTKKKKHIGAKRVFPRTLCSKKNVFPRSVT